jgi:hypothetical protein
VLARRIRSAVEAGRARVIYPRMYTMSRHMPAFTRVLLDALTPLPAASLAERDRGTDRSPTG